MTQPQNAVTQADDHNKVVSMRNVNKWFGQFHVLRDINLSVDKGERIVVCGPSGSGKSTLIRCLNRLEKHQDGDISVHGIELNNDVKNIDEIRREVGMVFQHFNLFPHLSILGKLHVGANLGSQNPACRSRRNCHAFPDTGENSRAGQQISRPVVRWPAAACGDCPCLVHAAAIDAV
jgi:general L-amino acid transport system ATP-binding protein